MVVNTERPVAVAAVFDLLTFLTGGLICSLSTRKSRRAATTE
jgi:hypothetical protein